MNTHVNFETAKLLKEKGFDLPSEILLSNEIDYTKHFSTPTIAEVVMWLYEKHGIWITVCVIGADGFGYWLHNQDRKRLNPDDQGGDFNSPTEAYSAAINYILKNLI